MQRREWLKGVGSAVCLSALPGIARSTNTKGWKTAIGLNGFSSGSKKYKKPYPIWEVLDFTARAGFDGVELVRNWPMGDYPSPDETARVNALKRLYDAFGLQIFSMQTSAGGAFSPDAAARKEWIQTFRSRAQLAKALGGNCIGIWPGGGLRGQTMDQAIDRLAVSFKEAGKIAGDLGLLAAFEIEPVFIFNTEDHLKRILEKTDHPSLKTIYDPSHFDLMNGSTGKPHEMLKRIGVEHIGYIHLTDTDGTLRDGGTSKHLAWGDGHVDVQATFNTLWDGGFRGWVMIDEWKIPDPYDACTKGIRAIKKFLEGKK